MISAIIPGNPFFPVDMLPTWFWALTVAMFGLAIGSFLNVVIYRLPNSLYDDDDEVSDGNAVNFQPTGEKKERITLFSHRRSVCPNCHHAITAGENIPLLSYLLLGGKCRGCKDPISLRYPFVEALTAAGFILAFLKQTSQPNFSIAEMVADSIFIAINIVLIFIDFDHMILPNVITYPGALVALAARFFIPNLTYPEASFYAAQFSATVLAMLVLFAALGRWKNVAAFKIAMLVLMVAVVSFLMLKRDNILEGYFTLQNQFLFYWQDKIAMHLGTVSLINGILGAIIGAGVLLMLREAYYVFRNAEGMGLGDIKMMLLVGVYLGWQLTIATLVVASLLGTLIASFFFIKEGQQALQRKIPFGVFLGAAAIILTLFGNEILTWYIQKLIIRD